jgi:hypothetical protein
LVAEYRHWQKSPEKGTTTKQGRPGRTKKPEKQNRRVGKTLL